MFNNIVTIHPFQYDPGCSQSQRVMDSLLKDPEKIDDRTLADLLNYFTELSAHIKYSYVTTQTGSSESVWMEDSWLRFFSDSSLPFTLAAASKDSSGIFTDKWQHYNQLFTKEPSVRGLQLLLYYVYYSTIYKFIKLYDAVKDTGLPVTTVIEHQIKNKLQAPLQTFMKAAYSASSIFGIKRIDFDPILSQTRQKDLWKIDPNVIYGDDSINAMGAGICSQMLKIRTSIAGIITPVAQAMALISRSATENVRKSLTGLTEDQQQRYTPHHALLFTFLELFTNLQKDINGFTKKHLDFFYRDVLRLQPKDAQPDKVHIVFELQRTFKQYALKKGLLLKGDKDKNGVEIDFAIEQEIILNHAQITDQRTLYLNKGDGGSLEGVYMTLKANTTDGIDKDFTGDPKNYPTLGGKYSKYIAPGTSTPQVYPSARIGFVLASPVLLLNEGERNITITLTCRLQEPCASNPVDVASLFAATTKMINGTYVYINSQLIDQAVKKGLTGEKAALIRTSFLTGDSLPFDCCKDGPKNKMKEDDVEEISVWNGFLDNNNFTDSEKSALSGIFIPLKPLSILFSGKQDWIKPDDNLQLSLSGDVAGTFTITIFARLHADQPAVTFYDKVALKEDLGTTLPLVKIEINDKIKMDAKTGDPGRTSFYQFFRNIVLDKGDIRVDVCGVRNIIVQNDESLQDINGPVYPFGTRPVINSNFYVGSSEIFYKNWQEIYVNHNWKNIPTSETNPTKPFEEYYQAYSHMYPDPTDDTKKRYIIEGKIKENDFKVAKNVLSGGLWHVKEDFQCPDTQKKEKKIISLEKTDKETKNSNDDPAENTDNLLFEAPHVGKCSDPQPTYTNTFAVIRSEYKDLPVYKNAGYNEVSRLNAGTRNGFLKFTLRCQDFLHNLYPFVLSRQMMAFGRLPDDLVSGAVYIDNPSGKVIVFDPEGNLGGDLGKKIDQMLTDAGKTKDNTEETVDKAEEPNKRTGVNSAVAIAARTADESAKDASDAAGTVKASFDELQKNNPLFLSREKRGDRLEALQPKEPWTPIITEMSIDYSAVADSTDITLIHLYPYNGTYLQKETTLQPMLFPTWCDEGTLFLGISDLIPGSELNILFQLAEATSDTESATAVVTWQYLHNNKWSNLRTGFEIVADATENLTRSGIIQFAFPDDISAIDNTVMPQKFYWIKAAVFLHSPAVCETIGIFTQAVKADAVLDKNSDTSRLSQPLKETSLSKLKTADANIKQITQPFPSFDGQPPELDGHFYTRVSELLRHKGRAIQKFDYERLVLEQFPEVFKAKCINHSSFKNAHLFPSDNPTNPGNILIAVIPDLTRLQAGESFEPSLPESTLEKIEEFLCSRSSPFVSIKAVNPRYEKINICLSVVLNKGYDRDYFKDLLEKELREFLAPWAIGVFDKLRFGECVNKSDLVYFLETREYIDYTTRLLMQSEFEPAPDVQICPHSPRSILLAGSIQICLGDTDTRPEAWTADDCNKVSPVVDFNKKAIIIPI